DRDSLAQGENVVTITATAGSTYSVDSSHNGKTIVVESSTDLSNQAMQIKLPKISGLSLPFIVSIQRKTGAPKVFINSIDNETIDGETYRVLDSNMERLTLLPISE